MPVTLIVHPGTGTIIDADDEVYVVTVESGDALPDEDIVDLAMRQGNLFRAATTEPLI
jgi:hypothetical protein